MIAEMTEDEQIAWGYYRAIDLLKRIKEETHEKYVDRHKALDVAIKALQDILEYQAIGTVQECQEAREKQRAKESIGIDMCTCPECYTQNKIAKKRWKTVPLDIVYCWHCGQALMKIE